MKLKNYGNEEDWLTARLDGIGASEASAVLGLSRFASPWSVWQNKVSLVVEPGKDMGPMADWGHRHEEAIVQRFFETMANDPVFAEKCPELVGAAIQDRGDYGTVWSGKTPIMFSTPDRMILESGLGDWRAVLEVKCAWFDAAREWNNQVPLGYQVQLQQAMDCCEVDIGFFAVLLNGYDFRWYVMKRSERFIKLLRSKLVDFWQLVLDGIPPAADFRPATFAAVADYYPGGAEDMPLPEDLEGRADALVSWQAKFREAKHRVDGLRNQFKAAMGNAERGTLPSGRAFTLRPNQNGVRVLRQEFKTKGHDDD